VIANGVESPIESALALWSLAGSAIVVAWTAHGNDCIPMVDANESGDNRRSVVRISPLANPLGVISLVAATELRRSPPFCHSGVCLLVVVRHWHVLVGANALGW